jgi:Tol biopolymer transport system component
LDRNAAVIGSVDRVTQGLNPHSISLSADGTRLAYSALAMRANIWVVDLRSDGRPADPAQVRPFTVGSQVVEAMNLSSDGRWIYFDSNLRGNQDLYRIPTDGGALEQLTTNLADDFHPDPSPDGREVAFHGVRNGKRDILVIPSGGGPESVVFAGPYEERWANWSPDGRAVSFAITEAPAGEGGLAVATRREDGSWTPPRMLGPREVQGHWSPDSKWLMLDQGFFDWDKPSVIRHLTRIYLESRRVDSIPLTIGDAIFVSVRIAPNGRDAVLRVVGLDRALSFWRMPLAGGPAQLLLRMPGKEFGGRGYWDTDGKRLYFARTERESDVYVAEIQRDR